MNEFQEQLMLDGYIQENVELRNINDKLSSALESAENRIDKAIEYINWFMSEKEEPRLDEKNYDLCIKLQELLEGDK